MCTRAPPRVQGHVSVSVSSGTRVHLLGAERVFVMAASRAGAVSVTALIRGWQVCDALRFKAREQLRPTGVR